MTAVWHPGRACVPGRATGADPAAEDRSCPRRIGRVCFLLEAMGMRALLIAGCVAVLALALGACAGHVEAGDGAGGGGGGACPAPGPGMCAPTLCVDGYQRTGQATCQGGEWVCTQAACELGAGGSGTGGCSGSGEQMCVQGQLQPFCCPAGAPCADQIFCDLGGGACVAGVTCDQLDGGAPCTGGTIQASSYDQSCVADGDCAPVYQGDLCSSCFCPNAAIAQSALAKYQADFAASGHGPDTCFCPDFPPPVCQGGVCVMP